MTTHVERSIEVAVPVRAAYDQWTRFEEFPHFMSGVEEVRQVGDAMTHWIAQIAGVRREWDAEIVEQVPDEKVAWAATTGATNAGAVYFDEVGADRTRVRLTLEFEPEGLVERIGDVLDIVDRQTVADLDRFKEFIEKNQGPTAGGWRGTIEDGDVVSESTGQQTNAEAGAATRGTADGVPGARTASHAGGTGDLVGEVGTGGHHEAWTDEPGARNDVTEASTDPVGEDWDSAGGATRGATSRNGGDDPGSRSATTGTDEAWASGGSGPGEDRGVRATGEDGVVQRDFADEDISTDDVVARDFANRDISGEGVVERDFADRDITERDIANRGVSE